MCDPKSQELLDSYRVDSERYAIGPFFADGVTILKQQIRALNLIFALAETKRIRNELDGVGAAEKARDIAVIGGGVAGMTAAAAATKLGNNVWHFEQRPELCHLQAGCDTRAVAPHIYDWPKAGSESPYAGLPALNWQAGTAAELTRCLVKAYEATQKEADDRLRLYLGATTFVTEMEVKWDNSIDNERGGSKKFDFIIIATGFGIERVVPGLHTLSYWRNDSINQATPGVTSEKTEQILVSGVGDGGLIDLLRAKIRGFNQAWIIDDLFFEEPELDRLRNGLEQIRSDCFILAKSPESKNPALFHRFAGLKTNNDTLDQFRTITKRLAKRLRKDVSAILNGPDDVFPDVLRFGRASLSNAFLVYLLYELNAFNYVSGGLMGIEQSKVTIEYPAPERRKENEGVVLTSTYSVDQCIVRHGTEKDKCLRMLGVLKKKDTIDAIFSRQTANSSLTSEPQWRPGYWSRSTKKVLEERGEGPKEFLPPPSQALASTFASMLSKTLMHDASAEGGGEFRLTVHRLIQLRDKDYFQQVSPYWGTRRDGEPARIIESDVGLVGLVCRTGKPIVLRRNNEDQQTWQELWEELRAGPSTHVRTPRENIYSMLAFPLFAKRGKDSFVSLVIFADSERPDMFVNPESDKTSSLLTSLFHAAVGFVDSCNLLQQKKVLRFATSSYWGIQPEPSKDHDLITKFEKKKALFQIDARIEGYNTQALTATIPLHWDCIYRNHEPLMDEEPRIGIQPDWII
jgi:Pyruvate/2-oxoglutarate dehydrogenase complex, dihydrolipoamide dehydrogenase (E3) component, and related enzymes